MEKNNDEGHLREVTRQLRGRATFQHRSDACGPSKDVTRVKRPYGSLNKVQVNRAKITIIYCINCLPLNNQYAMYTKMMYNLLFYLTLEMKILQGFNGS